MSKIYRSTNKTNTYIPSGYEQTKIKRFGEAIGEEDLTFLLSVMRDDGYPLVERAFNILMETDSRTKIKNKPAYLNGIIKNLRKGDTFINDFKLKK